ncbi:MAG: MBL fold metallo-hydrolase [Halioglobus sp.]|nr:MBL fold metallo-hydrolase [Halioglobus sp.]
MTGPGTNSYLLGREEFMVIDPGPAIDAHVDALCAAVDGRIPYVLVTHTHPDHSPAARSLAERCNSELLGRPAPQGSHQDATFRPDRVLEDGDVVSVDGTELRALHTPGHASNHLCFLRVADGLLFTGDHIINGSTVVIDPPDGNMIQYLESLARLRDEAVTVIAPGHGELLREPLKVIDWTINHRLQREAKVAAALAERPGTTSLELTATVYADVERVLHPVAERSLLAHLLKLQSDGRAACENRRWHMLTG